MLRTPREFAALQQSSKSKVHPLLVARFAPNDLERTRFGFSTGRRLGGAVTRNRVRRRLREAVRALGPRINPGWDVLIVARPASATATYSALSAGLERVLRGGQLLSDPQGSGGTIETSSTARGMSDSAELGSPDGSAAPESGR